MPQAQPVSSKNVENIDAGNAIIYVVQSPFASFEAARESTKWRKVGVLSGGANLELVSSKMQIRSGFPEKVIKTLISMSDLRVNGAMMEINPLAFALASGMVQSNITTTTKATNPSPTTVVSGSTQNEIIVDDATGFEAMRLIKVGDAFGTIKSISGNTLTMLDGLDLDENPAVGAAVAEVDAQRINIGSLAAPSNIAVKISKVIVSGVWSYDIYIPKVEADPNITLNWPDGNTGGGVTDPLSIPFIWEAVSDAEVESGDLAQAEFRQG